MTEELIIEQLAIWAPTITAILGIVVSALTSMKKVKSTLMEMRKDDLLKDIRNDLREALNENKELREQNEILMDQIAQIDGYVKEMKREKHEQK